MAIPATPGNFQVIRSEDRTSALCLWDSVQPYTVERYLISTRPWVKIVSTTGSFMAFHHGVFTGTNAATYKVQVVSVALDGLTGRVGIVKDGVVKNYLDVTFGVDTPFAVWDGVFAYFAGFPTDPPAVGEIWQWDVIWAERHIPALGADHYNLYQSERSNGLGFSMIAQVPNKLSVPRQFTAVDNLDPDLLYSFQLTAGTTMAVNSEPTVQVTDF